MQDFDPANAVMSAGRIRSTQLMSFTLLRVIWRVSACSICDAGAGTTNRSFLRSGWTKARSSYSTTNFGSGYGYLWWTAAPGRLPAGSYFAAGNGGQYVFVIPADDLAIVHLARMKSVGGRLPPCVREVAAWIGSEPLGARIAGGGSIRTGVQGQDSGATAAAGEFGG